MTGITIKGHTLALREQQQYGLHEDRIYDIIHGTKAKIMLSCDNQASSHTHTLRIKFKEITILYVLCSGCSLENRTKGGTTYDTLHVHAKLNPKHIQTLSWRFFSPLLLLFFFYKQKMLFKSEMVFHLSFVNNYNLLMPDQLITLCECMSMSLSIPCSICPNTSGEYLRLCGAIVGFVVFRFISSASLCCTSLLKLLVCVCVIGLVGR